MLGYEGAFGYDPKARLLIRWAGHNQGGGGEQNAETWTFDPVTARWTLKEPNTSPPGACCAQQNVFDPVGGRYLRFPAFSGSHGWHWFRENYLNNSSVWSYDLEKNTWRDMRSVPTPRPAPLRCASWDSEFQVAVIFGGEGSNEGTIVYDPYDNSWTRMNPKDQPAPRSAGNLAYDAHGKRHILFGSQFSDDPHTWAYDLSKNVWTDLKPAVQPPTDKNDAVLAYDALNRMIVASVRVAGKGDGADEAHYETWTYDPAKNTWRKMSPEVEPPGGGQRRRIMAAIPDQNVILMENYVNPPQKVPGTDREQQIWTYRFDTPKPERGPSPPTSVRVQATATGAILRWEGDGAERWIITRLRGPKPWLAKEAAVIEVSGKDREFKDDNLVPGEIYYYRLAGNVGETIGPAGITVRTQPRLVEDVIASVLTPNKVVLNWPAVKDQDFVGYHVERAAVEVFSEDQIVRLRKDTPPLTEPSVGAIRAIGPFVRLTKQPIRQATYTDDAVNLSKPVEVAEPIYKHRFTPMQRHDDGQPYRYAVYAYRIRAVNALGVESGGGPFALTIPSAPQWLFSKEEGAKCHLKWEKNPEEGIAGYRVYRMESPRINGPGQPVIRLTSKPIRAERFLDEKAGEVTRRYWVVAVDALGQEGFPSAPTWHLRQYRRYYQPFTGEWHQ
jgi:hypothetical protein